MIRPAGMPGGPQVMRGFQPPIGGRGGVGRGRGILGMCFYFHMIIT